jgi:catechol 2,3-dioxygenase-like lactoylglutathione lyase family enzyme
MFLRMDHAGMSVKNMEKVISFYQDIIGMEKVFDRSFDSPLANIIGERDAKARIVHMRLQDSVVELFDYDHPKGRLPSSDQNQSDFGLTHIGFMVQDFHETYEQLKAKGVKFLGKPVEIRPGVYVAYFHGAEYEICEMREIQDSQ